MATSPPPPPTVGVADRIAAIPAKHRKNVPRNSATTALTPFTIPPCDVNLLNPGEPVEPVEPEPFRTVSCITNPRHLRDKVLSDALSRALAMRLRSLPGLIFVAIALLLLLPSAIGYYTDWLWFKE